MPGENHAPHLCLINWYVNTWNRLAATQIWSAVVEISLNTFGEGLARTVRCQLVAITFYRWSTDDLIAMCGLGRHKYWNKVTTHVHKHATWRPWLYESNRASYSHDGLGAKTHSESDQEKAREMIATNSQPKHLWQF